MYGTIYGTYRHRHWTPTDTDGHRHRRFNLSFLLTLAAENLQPTQRAAIAMAMSAAMVVAAQQWRRGAAVGVVVVAGNGRGWWLRSDGGCRCDDGCGCHDDGRGGGWRVRLLAKKER